MTYDERDRRDDWLLRAGLAMPSWCATDPRLDAASAVVCAALDVLADASGVAHCDGDALAAAMRLHHVGEHEERLHAPLRALEALGIVTPLRGGGWLLRRLAVVGVVEPDEWSNEGIAAWFETLDEEQQETVRATLGEVVRRLAEGTT